MEAIRLHTVVEKDGEIFLSGLPFRKGQEVDLVLSTKSSDALNRPPMTARQLLNSGIVGLWKDRKDIDRSYARQLREQAQRRWE